MIIWVSIIVIFIISFILAVRSSASEFLPPHEVKKIRIRGKKRFFGVILFLKKKIIHYTSSQ